MASYRVLSGFPTLIVLLIWFSSILGHIYFWRWWSQWLPGIPVYSAFDSLGWSGPQQLFHTGGWLCTNIICSHKLKVKEFHDVVSFLQQPPSESWNITEVCNMQLSSWCGSTKYFSGGSSVGRSVSVAIHVLLTLGISTIGAGGKYRDGHACTQMSTPVVTVASSRLIYLFGCWQRKIF